MTGYAQAQRLGRLSSGRTGAAMLGRPRPCRTQFLGVVAASMAEISILAQASGISREAFLACLNKSVVGSQFTRDKTPACVNLDFEPACTSKLLRKGHGLGMAAARERGVTPPAAATVRQMVQGLVRPGYGDVDFAAFIAQQAESAGITLESEHADVSDELDPEILSDEEGGTGRER